MAAERVMDEEMKAKAEAAEAAEMMKRARVVHADPNAPKSPEQEPLPEKMAETPVEDKSPAEWAYERLMLYLQNFEEHLDNDHEVAMGFTGGEAGVLRIEGLGFFAPDLISFYGSDEFGVKTQLIQHVSQLNVLLRALPKGEPDAAPKRIGFRLAEDIGNG